MRKQYKNIPSWLTQVSGTISLTGAAGNERLGHQVAIFANRGCEDSTVVVHGWRDKQGPHWNSIDVRGKIHIDNDRVARAVTQANELVKQLQCADCRIISKRTKLHTYPIRRAMEKLTDNGNGALLSVPAATLNRVAF